MASISNIPTNSRSMNGIIILSDGVCNIEDGNITTEGDIITSNITTNDINLNLGGGRSLSVFDNLSLKATYTDILSLSGFINNNNNNSVISYENATNNTINLINNELITLSSLIYTNNNSVITYKNSNNLTINSISGNLVYLQNQINDCID